jgi:hypothetical protein
MNKEMIIPFIEELKLTVYRYRAINALKTYEDTLKLIESQKKKVETYNEEVKTKKRKLSEESSPAT